MEGEFHSRFGGLWIDRRDSEAELAHRVQRGQIGEELGERIGRFMADGYIVIPGAVPREVTEQIRQELTEHWSAPPDGALVETWDLRGKQQIVPPRPSLRRRPHKLLEFHAFSETARRAAAAPAVVEFLTAIFEARPKAFQSLTFWQGSRQAIHKDTAYVRIEDQPMQLAATWLALEDVRAGTGELQYYVGSHRDPEFLFGGEHKAMVGAPEDHPRFLKSLHDDAKRYGHPRERFRPKAGDVLIWHADLAHGGSPIRRFWSTRQSLVTHFTPEQNDPPYARLTPRVPVEQDGCLFISEHVQI